MEFRRKYIVTESKMGPIFRDSEDDTNDRLGFEFEALKHQLEPRHLRKFFNYDPRRKNLDCFHCLDGRTSWCDRQWTFAQRQKDKTIRCPVCATSYTEAEYKERFDSE